MVKPLWLSCVALVVLAMASDAQIVRKGELRTADRALIAAQGGPAAAGWFVDARAASGAVTRISGHIELHGDTLEERVADVITRFGPAFDIAPGGAAPIVLDAPRVLTTHGNGAPRQVRVGQLVHDYRVVNHELGLELDSDGHALNVRGIISTAAAALAAPGLSEADVLAAATAELEVRGHGPAQRRTQPMLLDWLVDPLRHGVRGFARVGCIVGPGHLPLAVDVDAATGEVLAVFEDLVHFGTGNFKFEGGNNPFKTGKGKGVVYPGFKQSVANKSATRPLPELAFETSVQGLAHDNDLYGRFALVLDERPDGFLYTITGFNHQFLGFPSDVNAVQADLFDAVNCYFHITNFGLWMTKLAGSNLATDFSMPTLVNSPFEPFNAFFSPQDLGVGTGPGFMLFGDNKLETGFLADDLARDPTVMAHEYLHAIASFSGLGFATPPVNVPNRAVNEAIADYFAATYFKDPRIGLPAAQLGSNQMVATMGLTKTGGLRNLAEPRTVIDNLLDVTVGGVPQEHSAGHIFGVTLWQVRQAVKQKIADRLIFDSMFNWPQSLAELGYVEFGPGNAVQAYIDFYSECLVQLALDAFATKGSKTGLRVLGAIMRHGGLGDAELGTGLILDMSTGGSAVLNSAFLGSSDGHLVGLAVNSGQTVSIKLVGNKKAGTLVDLGLDGPAEVTFTKLPVIGSNSIFLPAIQINQGGIYLLFPLNDGIKSTTPKPYKLTIKVK